MTCILRNLQILVLYYVCATDTTGTTRMLNFHYGCLGYYRSNTNYTTETADTTDTTLVLRMMGGTMDTTVDQYAADGGPPGKVGPRRRSNATTCILKNEHERGPFLRAVVFRCFPHACYRHTVLNYVYTTETADTTFIQWIQRILHLYYGRHGLYGLYYINTTETTAPTECTTWA